MHVTSLPGRHGSGDLGREALRFIDFLATAGQTWWQMLPVGPPGDPPGNSPYSSTSSAAGSPYLVSIDGLVEMGLLDRKDAEPPAGVRDDRVEFTKVRRYRGERLRRAFERVRSARGPLRGAYEKFRHDERLWLDNFALFSALRERHGRRPWWEWEDGLRRRKPAAMKAAGEALAGEINFHCFVQFIFDHQWRALRGHAGSRGVGLIGDIPIFVGHDSADVWVNPRLFRLDALGQPRFVTGVPPDAFSADGQRWGHPQYDWAAHARSNFSWWVDRFAQQFRLFDAVRIDHFLGFARVWSIPASSRTAKGGKWVKTPGDALFKALRKALGDRPIIAEDLGALTPEAAALRDRFGFPGMRVLQFGFDGGDAYHRPHGFVRNAVAYTGTHDNDTTAGWFRGLRAAPRRRVLAYVGRDGSDLHTELIRAVMASVANTAIVPVQDVLGLDGRARMNTPGKANSNWGWRVRAGALTPKVAAELKQMVEAYDRQRQSAV
jgi:4-alpha-glucanotransferase